MLTTLLFIVIIISCKTLTKGFSKLSRFSMIPFSKTKVNARLTSTSFYDDNDENYKRKKKYIYNYESDSNFNYIREEQIVQQNNEKLDNSDTLYTLIWFDCEDCKKLLDDVKNVLKEILYINGSYYFFDENDETNAPLFYKNDELIATDVFSIYEELFYNTVNEERT